MQRKHFELKETLSNKDRWVNVTVWRRGRLTERKGGRDEKGGGRREIFKGLTKRGRAIILHDKGKIGRAHV